MQSSRSPRAIAVACGLIATCCTMAKAQNLSSLGNHSVLTRGDFSTNSDVEGRTFVGGNLSGQNSSNFAIKLQKEVNSSDPTLVVAGDILRGNPINLNAGSLELGGSLSRTVNFNGGGALIRNPKLDYSEVIDELTKASEILAALETNSKVTAPGSQPGPFNFNASPDENGLAVFDIQGSDFFGNQRVQQADIFLNGATDVVINVGGSSINWQYGNLVGSFTKTDTRSRVVWNFYEAKSVNFDSKNMMGQVLAPNAAVSSRANIDGSIFADSLTTTSEVHLPGYDGNFYGSFEEEEDESDGDAGGTGSSGGPDPVVIPEPSSLLLATTGVLLLARRRRSIQAQ